MQAGSLVTRSQGKHLIWRGRAGYTNVFVTGADAGGGPDVNVFNAADTKQPLLHFFPYDTAFTGGVRVAAGDTNADGQAEIITAAGVGGGPNVAVFNGVTGQELASFFPYDIGFAGGVRVAGVARQRRPRGRGFRTGTGRW